MNNVAYFEIQAFDVAAAAKFYAAVFRWEIVRDPKIPIEYWRIQSQGMMGAILKRPAPTPPLGSGTNAYVCSIQVESFDRTAEAILKSGGILAMPKFAIPGRCWQGYFIDVDNNTFGIFQPDEAAR